MTTASEAPASRADTAVVVLDTSWTPGPDDRPDLLPLRRILAPVFGRVDLFNDALQRLDGWADIAGLPTRLSVRDVSIWYAMREELWHWLHERADLAGRRGGAQRAISGPSDSWSTARTRPSST